MNSEQKELKSLEKTRLREIESKKVGYNQNIMEALTDLKDGAGAAQPYLSRDVPDIRNPLCHQYYTFKPSPSN